MTPHAQLLVPIKPLHQAKSRLLGAIDGNATHSRRHAELVTAVARDTVEAAARAAHVSAVVVVTSDPELTESFAANGVEVVADTPGAGLNEALRHGERVIRSRDPDARVGALQADLPALHSAELDAALLAAGRGRAFCPDRHGTGTTLLVAEPSTPLDPRFGPRSAAQHQSSGAVPLRGRWASLTCDVDTDIDLRVATELGLGAHTRSCLERACPNLT